MYYAYHHQAHDVPLPVPLPPLSIGPGPSGMRRVGRHLPPKGHLVVRVGAVGEEQRRVEIPVGHLNHPMFVELLEEAKSTYGYEHEGAIAIPCSVEHFRHVQGLIERENSSSSGVQHQRRHSTHLHLPRFAGCFRA